MQNSQSMADSQLMPGVEPATPEEEVEMQRAQGALGEILYKNESSFQSIVKKLNAQNVPPLNRLIDTTVFLVTQIDSKINLDEVVILEFTGVVYDAVYEIAITSEAMQLDDKAIKQGLMMTLQVIMESYGVEEEEFSQYAESLGENAAQLVKSYKQETDQWEAS